MLSQINILFIKAKKKVLKLYKPTAILYNGGADFDTSNPSHVILLDTCFMLNSGNINTSWVQRLNL